jgi:hypothetical protein
MLIDDSTLEAKLKFLAKTDQQDADLLADVERAEFEAKTIKEAIFLHEDGSVAERNAKALTSSEYKAAMSNYFESLRKRHALRNERSRAVIVIECWRSFSSARTKGMIT